ncbi:MAG: hypothetical protein WA970_25030 [Gammaproteobacteria bacterium]
MCFLSLALISVRLGTSNPVRVKGVVRETVPDSPKAVKEANPEHRYRLLCIAIIQRWIERLSPAQIPDVFRSSKRLPARVERPPRRSCSPASEEGQ